MLNVASLRGSATGASGDVDHDFSAAIGKSAAKTVLSEDPVDELVFVEAAAEDEWVDDSLDELADVWVLVAAWVVVAAWVLVAADDDSTTSVFADAVAVAMELDDAAIDDSDVRVLQVRARKGAAARTRTCLRCTPNGVGCAMTEDTTQTRSREMSDLEMNMVIIGREGEEG